MPTTGLNDSSRLAPSSGNKASPTAAARSFTYPCQGCAGRPAPQTAELADSADTTGPARPPERCGPFVVRHRLPHDADRARPSLQSLDQAIARIDDRNSESVAVLRPAVGTICAGSATRRLRRPPSWGRSSDEFAGAPVVSAFRGRARRPLLPADRAKLSTLRQRNVRPTVNRWPNMPAPLSWPTSDGSTSQAPAGAHGLDDPLQLSDA